MRSRNLARVPLPLLVRMLIEESYEAQEESLGLLDRSNCNKIERDQAMQDLSGFRRRHMKDVRHAVTLEHVGEAFRPAHSSIMSEHGEPLRKLFRCSLLYTGAAQIYSTLSVISSAESTL